MDVFLWRKFWLAPLESQILQTPPFKSVTDWENMVFFFFSPLDVFVKTPLVFCFAALFGSFFPPSLRHPHRTRWASGIPDFFGAGVEKLQSEMSNHGVRVCSTSCWLSLWLFYFLATWIWMNEPFFPENEPAELVMTFPEFKRVPQNTFVRQNNSLHLFFLS